MVRQNVRTGMPLAEFVERYNRQPFELTGGEVVNLAPNVAGHRWVVQRLFLALHGYLTTRQAGHVAIETPFVLKDDVDWVKGSRTPDLSFYHAERWAAYTTSTPDRKEKPYILVPDLAIEVVSPNDRYSEIQDKVDGYLADGLQVIWVVDPQRRTVVIHTADSDQQTIRRDSDVLADDDVLPGFSVPVKSLFE